MPRPLSSVASRNDITVIEMNGKTLVNPGIYAGLNFAKAEIEIRENIKALAYQANTTERRYKVNIESTSHQVYWGYSNDFILSVRVNLFSAKNVGWISAAHPPCQLKKVDALRLSTLLLFDCTRLIKNQSSLIFRANLQEQIYPEPAAG